MIIVCCSDNIMNYDPPRAYDLNKLVLDAREKERCLYL